MVISARTGALIVIGEAEVIDAISDGGFVIDMPFSSQRLFELAKMDGAILLDTQVERVLKANVHLIPDPTLATAETGMRHRTAERVSRQTKALVVAISQRRNMVNLYYVGQRITLDDIDVVLAKANQALQTLQNYRSRLDEMLEQLTLLEFEDLVTLQDVDEVVGRFDLVRRVSREVGRYTLQLGTEGRLVRMQSDELTAGVEEQYSLVIRDYAADVSARRAAAVKDRLSALPPERLLEPDIVARELGLKSPEHAEQHLRPKGYRALAQIPMLPSSVIYRIVERFSTLPEIVRASQAELDAVDGVGERRARAIISGLARLRAHVSV
jgi:diadenylate cyclase